MNAKDSTPESLATKSMHILEREMARLILQGKH